MTAPPGRRWFRLASAWLIVLAGALLMLVVQLLRHWQDVLPPGAASASAEQGQQAGLIALPLLHGLAVAAPLLLFVFASSQWILAKETDPRSLRRHALRNGLLLAALSWPVASIGTLWLGLAFALAAALYLMAAYPPRGRSMFADH